MLKKIMMLAVVFGLYSQAAFAEQVLIKTNKGDIVLELLTEKSPKTVANFKRYVNEQFYDGLIFHRVIDNFMVQGGGFNQLMQNKAANYKVENESLNGVSNVRGTVAMARTNDPHSASSQFFINVVDNTFLDAQGGRFGYAVFARVLEGMQVVDVIKSVPTAPNRGHSDVPTEAVIIESMQLLDDNVEEELQSSTKTQSEQLLSESEVEPNNVDETIDQINSDTDSQTKVEEVTEVQTHSQTEPD